MGNFKELRIWQEAKDIAVSLYKITESDNFKKDFGIIDQIRRASISIASNIAEGDERNSNKESIRFLYISIGSIAELITQLTIAYEVGYLKLKDYQKMLERLESLSKQIKTLIKHRTEISKKPLSNKSTSTP